MPEPRYTELRYLAPVALVVCAIAFLGVIAGSDGGGDKSSDSSAEPKQQRTNSRGGKKTTTKKVGSKRGVYTVKAGDSLGSIAAKTGQPVDKLQELNPDLDPQALISGQKVKLRR